MRSQPQSQQHEQTLQNLELQEQNDRIAEQVNGTVAATASYILLMVVMAQ